MTNKELYGILGLKPFIEPVRPKIICIVSQDAKELHKAAANSITQNHPRTHGVGFSNLMITEYKENVAVSYTYFVQAKSPDTVRGINIDTVFIDDLSGLSEDEISYIECCIVPAAKEIIYLDKPEEV